MENNEFDKEIDILIDRFEKLIKERFITIDNINNEIEVLTNRKIMIYDIINNCDQRLKRLKNMKKQLTNK